MQLGQKILLEIYQWAWSQRNWKIPIKLAPEKFLLTMTTQSYTIINKYCEKKAGCKFEHISIYE